MTIIRFTTIPETFRTEIWKEDEYCIETILPAFYKISPSKLPTQLTPSEIIIFHQHLENDLRKRLQHYKPERGNAWPEIIFGQEYLLTKLSRQHEAIHTINYLYENTSECIKNNLTLNIYYSG